MEKRPLVGLGVIVKNEEGKVLMGKRKNAHGEGSWCFPGGHLEYGESLEECAIREAKEETTIEIDNVKFETITNDVFEEGKHYITIYMSAQLKSGEVKVNEPEKCEKWEWFYLNELPKPLFLPIESLIKQNNKYSGTKLVRDNIPQIIEKRDAKPAIHKADDNEYKNRLIDKLEEELNEFKESYKTEELADILEVLYAICDQKGVDRKELEKIRKEKKYENGGFDKRIILDGLE